MPNNEEPRISQDALAKSVETLTTLLQAEAPALGGEGAGETVEKAMEGTNGGLTLEAGAPEIDPTLTPEPVQEEGDGLGGEDAITKSDPNEAAGLEMAAELSGESDEEFAKSLSDAFTGHEAVIEAAQKDEFAKSLVLGTIESLSIANTEMHKALSGMEERQDEKIAALAKGLIALSNAVAEIHKEVVAVSNAPARPSGKSVRSLEKGGFGGESETSKEVLQKAQALDALQRLVEKGEATVFDVARYESTGTIDRVLASKVQNELGK